MDFVFRRIRLLHRVFFQRNIEREAEIRVRRKSVQSPKSVSRTSRLMPVLAATTFFFGAAMAATDAASLAGTWKLDGAFAPSGETLSMTITELPGHQWRLTLPKDIRPEGSNGQLVLHEVRTHVYSSPAGEDVGVRVTVSAPGAAQMSINIDNKKGFARFGYGMTRIGH